MNTPLKLISLTSLIILLFVTTSYAATLTGKVIRVLDGDTIEVLVNKEQSKLTKEAISNQPPMSQERFNKQFHQKNPGWKQPSSRSTSARSSKVS